MNEYLEQLYCNTLKYICSYDFENTLEQFQSNAQWHGNHTISDFDINLLIVPPISGLEFQCKSIIVVISVQRNRENGRNDCHVFGNNLITQWPGPAHSRTGSQDCEIEYGLHTPSGLALAQAISSYIWERRGFIMAPSPSPTSES